MRFVGIAESGFKIIDPVGLEDVRELGKKFETSWLDIDKVDPNIEADVKRLYGIGSIQKAGYPRVEPLGSDFDKFVLNYYENFNRFELQVFVSSNFIITVHPAEDKVVEETIASLNQITQSGDDSPSAIIAELLNGIADKNESEIDQIEKGSRKAILRLKSNEIDIGSIFSLERSLRRVSRSIHVTKMLVSDVMNQNIKTPFIKNAERFQSTYMVLDLQDHRVADLYETMNDIIESMLPNMWKYLNTIKKFSTGIAVFGAALGLGAFSYLFGAGGAESVFGMPSSMFLLLFLVLGIVGFVFMQKNMRF